MNQASIDVDGTDLVVRVPLELLAFAAEQRFNNDAPFDHKSDFRVTDAQAFGRSVAACIRAEDEDGTALWNTMLDDAIEGTVEIGEPGFEWPSAGLKDSGDLPPPSTD